jgi:hypothetical protein
MATLDMDVPSILKCSTYCEERLRTFHRQCAYADITQLQNAFTSEDLQLAQQILSFIRGLSVMTYDSSYKSLGVEFGVRSSLHSHFRNLYMPVRVRADGNCLYHAISKGLVGDYRLSTILRFGCIGVFLQYKDYFTSHVVDQSKIFFWDDVEGEVVLGTLIDVGFLLGTLSNMVFPKTVISIPNKLRNIPLNTLCYGGPSQILALSILTNRTINVYGHYLSEKLAKDISEADFQSFLNEKKNNTLYEWETKSVQNHPLSIYLQHDHFTLLMPRSETHFKISYHFIFPKDCQFIKKKISEDMFIHDNEPMVINLESSDVEEPVVVGLVPSTNAGAVGSNLKSTGDNSSLTSIDHCRDFSIIISSHERAIADLALNSINEELTDEKYVSSSLFSLNL